MSVVSKFLETNIGNFIKNLFLNAIKECLNIYINTKYGKFILTIEIVSKRDVPKNVCIYWFIAFEGLILRFTIKPNN